MLIWLGYMKFISEEPCRDSSLKGQEFYARKKVERVWSLFHGQAIGLIESTKNFVKNDFFCMFLSAINFIIELKAFRLFKDIRRQ